jgi:hypothetical protein
MRHLPVRLAAAIAATAFLAAGCLDNTYRIPHASLMQLSMTPPEQRGQRVRVVQGVGGSDDPPAADGVDVHAGVVVVVDGDGDGPASHPGGGPSGGGSPAHPHANVPSAKAAQDDARAWIVAAIVVGVALVATEGARYDGWVRIHPMMPVHLYGPYGEYMVVPLAQITPEQAAWSRRAVIRETEGPFERLDRAPLDRVGFTYGITVGSAVIPSANGDETAGFMGHISLGVWPTQMVGILGDVGLGWRNNEQGLAVFDGRYALELDVMPVHAGSFHVGGYGQFGFANRVEDRNVVGNGDATTRLFGGGLQGQLEITTRLALTARAGMTWEYGDRVPEFQLGLSIY